MKVNIRGKYKMDVEHGAGRKDGVKKHRHKKGSSKHRHVKK